MGGSVAGTATPVTVAAKQHIFHISNVVHPPLESLDPALGIPDENKIAGEGN